MRTFNLIYQHNSDILCCHNKLSVKKELKENVVQFPSMAFVIQLRHKLEIVITRAAPAFHKMFMVMGCVFDINTVHKIVNNIYL